MSTDQVDSTTPSFSGDSVLSGNFNDSSSLNLNGDVIEEVVVDVTVDVIGDITEETMGGKVNDGEALDGDVIADIGDTIVIP